MSGEEVGGIMVTKTVIGDQPDGMAARATSTVATRDVEARALYNFSLPQSKFHSKFSYFVTCNKQFSFSFNACK